MDDIIDLGDYLRRREEVEKVPRTAFAVWGGEGERTRFALPLWRVVYLAGGARGGIVSVASSDEHPTKLVPFVVLDLAEEPARTRFSPTLIQGLAGAPAPTLRIGPEGGMGVHLGEHDGRRWYLVVDDTAADKKTLEGRARDDILFLAGECAGLLFFRGLATDAEDES